MVYASSIDSTAPLLQDLCFVKDGKRKPIVTVLHGLSGRRADVALDLEELAAKGLFAIAPDMRGRTDSAGKPDCSGIEIYDIIDGVLAAASQYPAEVDINNINFMGYSGGGANGFAAVTRFPDLFNVVGIFFGFAEYRNWYQLNEARYGEILRKWIGGSPDEKPQEYAARNFALSAANNGRSKIHIFYDEKETVCPLTLTEKFLERYHAAGLTNAFMHKSLVTDSVRWIHGYRSTNPMLTKADDILVPQILERPPKLSLSNKGTMTVCGYLATRAFQVFVEDGRRGVVKIEYDLSGMEPKITVTENFQNWKVSISLESPLLALAKQS